MGTMAELVVGIDVSKDSLSCTLIRRSEPERVIWQVDEDNTEAGVRRLLKRSPAEAVWVLEPTGRYSEGVVRQAVAAGRRALMASPRRARHYLRSRRQRGKSDRVDSHGLAQYGAAVPLPPYPLKEERVQQVEQLLAARREVAESLGRLRQQARELPYARAALAGSIEALTREVKAIERQLAAAVRADPTMEPVRWLREVPGFGPVISAALCARLNDKPFRRADSFVAYVGLDVTVSQSGQKRAPGQISHEGDAELRRLLFVAALAAVRTKGSPFTGVYQRLVEEGRPKTAALCIIARKLGRLAWSIHHHESRYDRSRVYGEPADRRASQPA